MNLKRLSCRRLDRVMGKLSEKGLKESAQSTRAHSLGLLLRAAVGEQEGGNVHIVGQF